MTHHYGDDDPISAPATVQGESALAVIRTSGKNSIDLLAQIFSRSNALKTAKGNSVIYGWIINGKEKIDEVLVSVYRAPRSYTGEDSADISCHGGIATVNAIMRFLNSIGFRPALPGEFTFRAFMNGKLDLTKAESVMELVSSKTDIGRRQAVNRLSGILEKEINEIKKLLVESLASAELFLDYSEDEIGSIEEEKGILPHRNLVEKSLISLYKLAESYRIERIYQNGALVVIAGKPNSGKSSLFNLLIKEDRSIVTDIPGTTRDWISAQISLEGIPIHLADTAGLRDTKNAVEKIGVEKSRELLETADLVIYLIDGTLGLMYEDEFFLKNNKKETIIVWNKIDTSPKPETFPLNLVGISAKTGKGVLDLSSEIVSHLARSFRGLEKNALSPAIATERQKKLIDSAIENLEDVLKLSEEGKALDIIAPQIREAINALGEITGEVSTTEILEVMFSNFCVGK